MADILREVFGIFQKRYRDMGDGTHAEVVAANQGTTPWAMADSWRAFSLIDEAADDSDKSFVVPADTERLIYGVRVSLATTATAGNRQIVIEVQDDAGKVVSRVLAGAVQAASLTREYNFGLGAADWSAFVGDYLSNALPVLKLSAGWTLRVFDSGAVDAAADDMSVFVSGDERAV